MSALYERTIDEVYKALGAFSKPYEIDKKRFASSLRLLNERELIRGKKILDLGSGVCIFPIALKRLGAEVVGFDKFIFPSAFDNPYRIADFKALQTIWDKEGITVREGDLLKRLPFEEGEFDLVNSDCTIEHLLDSPKSLFAEVRRVLRPGGTFLLTTPNLANLSRRIRFLLGRSPHWDLREYFDGEAHFTGHRREFTLSELCELLSWSGFSVTLQKTQNSFFSVNRLLHPRKWMAHVASALSFPFPRMREILFVLCQKPVRKEL